MTPPISPLARVLARVVWFFQNPWRLLWLVPPVLLMLTGAVYLGMRLAAWLMAQAACWTLFGGPC